MAGGDTKRWLKYGCLGCLGCLGLIVLGAAMIVGSAWLGTRSEHVEERVLSHPTPEATPKGKGKVELDLSDAEFRVEPAAAGEPIRVEGSYDADSFALEETSGEEADGTWTYRVAFRRTRSSPWFVQALGGLMGANKPKVIVRLPREVPIALEMEIERGGLVAELGGLQLTSGLLHVQMGGLEVHVSEPLAEPMERLEVRTEMGGGAIRQLGNASPRVLDIRYSMGGMDLDLTGAWRADAEIAIEGSMGGGTVRLPRDVRVEGVPGRTLEAPQKGELQVPTLRFKASSAMGDLRFR